MRKLLLFVLPLLLLTTTLEAQRYRWCGCRRYMYPTLANYDGYYYGYVDNINYPDPYALPINRYFNYCPPCRCDTYNVQYLENCIRYTNYKNHRDRRAVQERAY